MTGTNTGNIAAGAVQGVDSFDQMPEAYQIVIEEHQKRINELLLEETRLANLPPEQQTQDTQERLKKVQTEIIAREKEINKANHALQNNTFPNGKKLNQP